MDNNEVIDLTQSFTYSRAPCPSLSCSVIELDDSVVDESTYTTNTTTTRTSVTVAGPIVEIVSESNPDLNVSLEIRRRKSKTEKRNSKSSAPSAISIRERSPLSQRLGDCPICRDPLGRSPMASTKCGHVYCVECIKMAVRIEKKCPTCRTPLKGATAYHKLFL